MHRDGILHVKEAEAIKQTAIGVWIQKPLNELKKMENAPNVIIPADIIENFREERN
jgi:hypothetical protein